LPVGFADQPDLLDCAGKHTDHTRCDDGVVPLICPASNGFARWVRRTPTVVGYFAWGFFRCFCYPVTEASDRT
jgi:hypothetical protein